MLVQKPYPLLTLRRQPRGAQDLAEYKESGQKDRCLAIQALLAVQAQQRQIVCALLDAAGALIPPIPGRMGQFDKQWKEWSAELRAAASPGGAEGCELGQRVASQGGSSATASDLVFA